MLVSLDADRITVRSSTPSAPGSRPEGTLASGARFWMKVARCRREGDGFVIDGRVLDATRDTRGELERLVPDGGDPDVPPCSDPRPG